MTQVAIRRLLGLARNHAARPLLDAVLPPRCLSCREPVERQGTLCAGCWERATFLSGAVCDACGFPFEVPRTEAALCGACIRHRPAFARARAAMVYDDSSRKLVLGFKHGDRTEAAAAFGGWMARAGEGLLKDADLLVPVPLHWTRLLSRRHNQAALLAHEVSRLASVPACHDVLVRRKRTGSQGGLNRQARARNVRGAFKVPRRRRALISGKRVILVDDVFTTGATAEAASRALSAAGAAAVDVLCLARVVRGPK